jgi:hypothetical protein
VEHWGLDEPLLKHWGMYESHPVMVPFCSLTSLKDPFFLLLVLLPNLFSALKGLIIIDFLLLPKPSIPNFSESSWLHQPNPILQTCMYSVFYPQTTSFSQNLRFQSLCQS